MKLRLLCLLLSLLTFTNVALAAGDPVANPITINVVKNVALWINLSGTQVDNHSLTYATASSPSHGTLSGLNSATGIILYTPTASYTGTDSFTYTVAGNNTGGSPVTSAAAAVSIIVVAGKTTINGQILNPDTSVTPGTVTWVLQKSSTTYDGFALPASSSVSATLDGSGNYTLSVYPTAGLNPNSYYEVHFRSTAGVQSSLGLFNVPISTTAISQAVVNANAVASFSQSAQYCCLVSSTAVNQIVTAINAGAGTVTASTTDTFTNKTITSTTNTIGGVTMTLGSDATGDVYYRNSSGILTRLAIGASTTVLHGGTTPSFSAVAAATDITGTLPINRGGTGTVSTFTDKTIPVIQSGVYAQSNIFFDGASSRIGLGASNTSPSYNLSIGTSIGSGAIGVERRLTTGNGLALNIIAGGGTLSATDKNGGTLHLNAGQSTGAGTAIVDINGYSVGGTGTSDNSTLVYATFNAAGVTLNGDWLPASNAGSNIGNSSTGISQLFIDYTNTAGGTTGAQTINKASGSVNFAAAATSLVVTNSKVTTNSNVQCTVATNDATMKSVQCVVGSGSITMFAGAAPTAETRVRFYVIGQ